MPGVRKAVRWNSPFYGIEDQVWFLSYHLAGERIEGYGRMPDHRIGLLGRMSGLRAK